MSVISKMGKTSSSMRSVPVTAAPFDEKAIVPFLALEAGSVRSADHSPSMPLTGAAANANHGAAANPIAAKSPIHNPRIIVLAT